MTEINILDQPRWYLLPLLGFKQLWLEVNAKTMLNTWFVLLLLVIFLLICRLSLNKKTSIIRHLVLTGVASFVDLAQQTFGRFIYQHTAFVISLFLFITFCNCICIIPGITEPTQDLNTALALGCISFFYKEFYALRTHGFSGYCKEFVEPFFLMLPVNIIGHFSKLISLSFRLFGNIFGGSIIMELHHHFIAQSIIGQIINLFGLNIIILLFFGIFEGVIQAFVFTMLSLTYLGIAIQEEILPGEET